MEASKYKELGTDWQSDSAIDCCTKNPSDTPSGCDCCYDNWTLELKKVKLEYNKINEQAIQLNEHYKFVSSERDKLKSWLDDLDKAHLLAVTICEQFEVMSSQTEKICKNADKTVEAIEILFCMIRDLYEQADRAAVIYNEIETCIKCLNSDDLPENSGIRKCLKLYFEKLDAVIKTRNELLKAMMMAIKQAYMLLEAICSEYGLVKVIADWQGILNCGEKCGSPKPPADPCKYTPPESTSSDPDDCPLVPILSLPICNDAYYAWVKKKYNDDVADASTLSTQLMDANKKKEALAACQASLIAAIKEVNPKELCK